MVDLAVEAEAAGWDGVFYWDHIQWRRDAGNDVHDPWVLLGAVAARTATVRLGAMVTPLPRRRPQKLAKELITLDHLSAGRVVVGVGLGAPAHDEFAAFGDEADDRVRARRLDESLGLLDELLEAGRSSTTASTSPSTPTSGRERSSGPARRSGSPAVWPNRRPMARAARWDGVIPISADGLRPEQLAQIVEWCGGSRPGFDVVATAIDGVSTAELADAGATWHVVSTWPLGDWLPDFRRRVLAGPPS